MECGGECELKVTFALLRDGERWCKDASVTNFCFWETSFFFPDRGGGAPQALALGLAWTYLAVGVADGNEMEQIKINSQKISKDIK